MRYEHRLALLLGRVLDLLRRTPDAVDDHKAALRSLVALTAEHSVTIRQQDETLTIEGAAIPPDTPFVATLSGQLRGHRVGALHVACDASALDLITFLRALALPPIEAGDAQALEARLQEARIVTISVLDADRVRGAHAEGGRRVTDALKQSGVLTEEGAAAERPDSTVRSSDRPEHYDAVLPRRDEAQGVVAGTSERLKRRPQGLELMGDLHTIARKISDALKGSRIQEAMEGVAAVMRHADHAEDGETQRACAIALQRIATPEALQRFAGLIIDEIYAVDVVNLMKRAGPRGTQVLLDKLVEAPTFAERKAYLSALRSVEAGVDIIISMFGHHEWYVLRNVADLVGELRVEEAIPALGRIAEHDDPRVRRSVGVALARIGTPATVPFLRTVMRDPDPEIRLAVAQAVGGRGLGALAMPVVAAVESEEDPGIQCEYYRALGRIGTADAVQILQKVVQPGGVLFGRRAAGPRLAAIEGLGASNNPAARPVLEALAADRGKDVREAARSALGQLRRVEASGA
jgi:HEAT repeat protein